MIALLLALALGQPARCDESAVLIAAAAERAGAFDRNGAVAALTRSGDCAQTEVPLWYIRGLIAARDAYRYGGSVESLEPVTRAVEQLSARAAESAAADIARVVLRAASAAAQSEREELALLLDHARQLERQQLVVNAPVAPIISAHEIAGDLWLQVHRFEDARVAYTDAARQIGRSPRVTLGLARVAVRLNDLPTACAEYGRLLDAWTSSADPPELAEARAFLRTPACQA